MAGKHISLAPLSGKHASLVHDMCSLVWPHLRKQEGSGDSSIVYLCELTENWCVQSNRLPAHLVTWISVLPNLIGGKYMASVFLASSLVQLERLIVKE